MGIQESATNVHWNYFLALDADVERLARFVEFREDNFATYSIEMARLLLTAASEVDVVAKLVCKSCNEGSSAKNIEDYRRELSQAFSRIPDIEVTIPRYGLTLAPWSDWQNDKTPDWWSAYNRVKHERNAHFRKANLKNTLNAIGGLFVLLLHYYRADARKGELGPEPFVLMAGPKLKMGLNLSTSLTVYDV